MRPRTERDPVGQGGGPDRSHGVGKHGRDRYIDRDTVGRHLRAGRPTTQPAKIGR
jgi:hypothetical protein